MNIKQVAGYASNVSWIVEDAAGTVHFRGSLAGAHQFVARGGADAPNYWIELQALLTR